MNARAKNNSEYNKDRAHVVRRCCRDAPRASHNNRSSFLAAKNIFAVFFTVSGLRTCSAVAWMNEADTVESSGKRRQRAVIARWQRSVQVELYLQFDSMGAVYDPMRRGKLTARAPLRPRALQFQKMRGRDGGRERPGWLMCIQTWSEPRLRACGWWGLLWVLL